MRPTREHKRNLAIAFAVCLAFLVCLAWGSFTGYIPRELGLPRGFGLPEVIVMSLTMVFVMWEFVRWRRFLPLYICKLHNQTVTGA